MSRRFWLKSTMNTTQGFTLVEVMIALGILAVSLAGVLTIARETTSNTLYLQQKAEAHWVANNVLAQIQLDAGQGQPLSAGRLQGVTQMGTDQWFWQADMRQGRDLGVLQVVVNVSPNQTDGFIEEVQAYVSTN